MFSNSFISDAFIPLLSPSNLHWFSSDALFSSVVSSSSFSSTLPIVEDPFDIWRFVGILLGLAVYNGIIIPAQFPLVLYKKMLGQVRSKVDTKILISSISFINCKITFVFALCLGGIVIFFL